MQPESLYNQLRFNLNQPYDINKLSVRHKNPKPLTIEKAGVTVNGSSRIASDVKPSAPNEEEFCSKFSTLNLARLKEAQFLAQRELKRQKSSLVCLYLLVVGYMLV